MDLNLVSKLWKKKLPMHCYVFDFLKFMNVVKLVVVQNIGFGKHERIFLTLMFMKIANAVEHLDLMVCMFAQPFYIVDIFFYDDVIIT